VGGVAKKDMAQDIFCNCNDVVVDVFFLCWSLCNNVQFSNGFPTIDERLAMDNLMMI